MIVLFLADADEEGSFFRSNLDAKGALIDCWKVFFNLLSMKFGTPDFSVRVP